MSSYQSLIFVFPRSLGATCRTLNILVQNVTEKNVRDVLPFQAVSYVEEFFQFLENGDEGFYAYLDGKCCHRSWLQKGPQWVQLNPWTQMWLGAGEGYIHYCETAPWARGKGIYPAVLNHIADRYPQRKLFISVESNNIASVKGIERAGFKKVGEVLVYHFGLMPIFWRSRGEQGSKNYSVGVFFFRRIWKKLCNLVNSKNAKKKRDSEGVCG